MSQSQGGGGGGGREVQSSRSRSGEHFVNSVHLARAVCECGQPYSLARLSSLQSGGGGGGGARHHCVTPVPRAPPDVASSRL